jgi:hypothetical protein
MARRSLGKQRNSKSKRTTKSATRKATKTKKLSGGKRKKHTGRSKKVSNRKRKNTKRKHNKRKHKMSGGSDFMEKDMGKSHELILNNSIKYIQIKDGI